jgi:nitrite reductase/ring-hydroxylating ferredoxin subunit/uncharacterized membrane protein
VSANASVSRPKTPLEPLVSRIESMAALDPPASWVAGRLRSTIPAGPIKDALSGVAIGHALHPLLTDLVIGSLMSATLVDLLAGEQADVASRRLIALGIASYGPTALTGASDWADAEPGDDRTRRAGLVHAATNATSLALYSASLVARRRGATGAGRALGAAGAALLMAGGYLGGHLTFRLGIGPDQTAYDPGSTDWLPAADAAQLPDGQPTRVVVDETPVLVLKDGEEIFAIHDRCSHRGCSLAEGSVEGDAIVCACHGSRFSRRDGSLLRGPATAPQPAFQVRIRDGIIEVRRLAVASA